MLPSRRLFLLVLLISNCTVLLAAPTSSWYLDELGSTSFPYDLDDDLGSNDGVAFVTPSTGNAQGKVCSALNFSTNSVFDYATLGEAALDGATNLTVSVWLKGTSAAGRSLLSGARPTQANALIMWFPDATHFVSYINNSTTTSIAFPSIADNNWHHFVWRRLGNQSCVFTDGVNRGCSNVSTAALDITSLILAQEQDSVGGSFDINQDWEGLVDELLVFREGLSDTEVLSIFNNQNAGNSWDGGVRNCQTLPPDPPIQDTNYSDWHFDETSWSGNADEIVDSHDTHHGIGINVSPVPGKLCNGIDLRASTSSDRAILGAGALDGSGDFTISVWHNGTPGDDSNAILSGAVTGSFNELIYWFPSATNFNGFLKNGSLGNVSSSNINTNNWRHMVWRRSSGQSCLFIDTILQGCQASPNFSTLNISSLILGQEQDNLGGGFSSAQDWEGILDELLIFRRPLSIAEINNIFTNQNNGLNWDGTARVCPGFPVINITKTSMVLSDPVNIAANPKSIPGSIMRYCFTVDITSGMMSTEDVSIDDSLTGTGQDNLSYINSGKVIQNITTSCNCAGITDTSGTITGTDVSIPVGTLTAAPASARSCAYIEVSIN